MPGARLVHWDTWCFAAPREQSDRAVIGKNGSDFDRVQASGKGFAEGNGAGKSGLQHRNGACCRYVLACYAGQGVGLIVMAPDGNAQLCSGQRGNGVPGPTIDLQLIEGCVIKNRINGALEFVVLLGIGKSQTGA